jgi:hypothetical protein
MKDLIYSKVTFLFRGLIGVGVFVAVFACPAAAQTQQWFSTPEDAVKALKAAVKARDQAAFTSLFGPRIREFNSGDPVDDKNALDTFASNISRSTKLRKVTEEKFELLIGESDWPFAAPIVKSGRDWRFDTDEGVDEMLSRRIGMNEFFAMHICQAYAVAQFEYFNGDDRDGDQVSEYAQKIASSPGTKDGLYWDKAGEYDEDSPLGPLFAFGTKEGYKAQKGTTESAAPFHGYKFKVLYGQGASAPGGKFGYVINGNMLAGFALVAYPATWGNSGVMTFIVNQEGRVYEKDLGPRTAAIASAMTVYNPDVTWTLSDPD